MKILDTYNLRINLDGDNIIFQIRTKLAVSSVSGPFTRSEALDLADKLQDAATAIRAALAEEDPGSAFERAQAIQFGAERLEGDL